MDDLSSTGCGADVAAYALGALDDHELPAFERHLEGCAICRDELAAFRGATDLLAMTVPAVAPPRSLKRSVMAAVAADAARRRPAPEQRRSWLPRVSFASPRMGLALAATVIAIVAGALVIPGLGASSTQVITAQVIGQKGQAQLRRTGDRTELVVNHLAPPPAGEIYQVWLARPGRPLQPTNALFSTRNGSGDVDVPGKLTGVTGVMVTPEPAGGSSAPTHSPIIRASLA